MLSITEYEYIKLLYDKYKKSNDYIRDLMQKDEWDSVEYAVDDKNETMKLILQFEKVHKDNIKLNPELTKIRKQLIEMEKSNIELLKTLKEEAKNELDSVSKAKKVLNKYEPDASEGVSTINITDTEG